MSDNSKKIFPPNLTELLNLPSKSGQPPAKPVSIVLTYDYRMKEKRSRSDIRMADFVMLTKYESFLFSLLSVMHNASLLVVICTPRASLHLDLESGSGCFKAVMRVSSGDGTGFHVPNGFNLMKRFCGTKDNEC